MTKSKVLDRIVAHVCLSYDVDHPIREYAGMRELAMRLGQGCSSIPVRVERSRSGHPSIHRENRHWKMTSGFSRVKHLDGQHAD